MKTESNLLMKTATNLLLSSLLLLALSSQAATETISTLTRTNGAVDADDLIINKRRVSAGTGYETRRISVSDLKPAIATSNAWVSRFATTDGAIVMHTNQNNGATNPQLNLVMGHANRGMYVSLDDVFNDGAYGSIYFDPVHDSGVTPGSASQYELQVASPHNIALGAGFVNGGKGHYQIGIGTVDGTHAPWWYFNTATPVTPGNNYSGFSMWTGFRSFFSDAAGGQTPRYAGMFSKATSNSFTLEITGSPNTNFGDMFQSGDAWSPATTPQYRAIFEFGSNQNLISFSVPTNLYIGGNSYFTNSAQFLDTFRLGPDGAYTTVFQSLAALFLGPNFSHAVSIQIGDGGGNTIANFGGGTSFEGNYVKTYGLAINKNGAFTPAVNSECTVSNALEVYGNCTITSNQYVLGDLLVSNTLFAITGKIQTNRVNDLIATNNCSVTNALFVGGTATINGTLTAATVVSTGNMGAPAWVLTAANNSISSGTGSPESVITAPVGSLFLRTDGGVSTTLYVKTSGAGSTGWTAK